MPYRRAWIYLSIVLSLSVIAFWPSYFGTLGTAPWTAHLHGITAMVWVALMASQVLLIHNKKRSLHRTIGLLTITTVPIFTMGGFLVVQTLVKSRADFAAAVGSNLALIDVIAIIAFGWLCYMSLSNRSNPALHGGYLLVTPLLLTESILTRLLSMHDPVFQLLPGDGLAEKFHFTIDVSQLLAIALSGLAAWHYRKHPQPFYAIAALSALGWGAYRLLGDSALAWGLVELLKEAPQSLVAAFGGLVGAISIMLGWQHGSTSRGRRAAHGA